MQGFRSLVWSTVQIVDMTPPAAADTITRMSMQDVVTRLVSACANKGDAILVVRNQPIDFLEQRDGERRHAEIDAPVFVRHGRFKLETSVDLSLDLEPPWRNID